MIFFTEAIENFKSEDGMNISPIPTTLTDDREGFRLGGNWKDVIELKGITVELIGKEDIKVGAID